MGFDGATVLGIGFIVGGLGLLATAVAGGRRQRGVSGRPRRPVRRVPPVRPQWTGSPAGPPDASRSKVSPARGNLPQRPQPGDPRPRGNERPRPVVDPRRFPPGQPAPVQPGTPPRRMSRQVDPAADTVLLQPVPAWSQPIPATRRDRPRNDPPRADLMSAPIAAAVTEARTDLRVHPRAAPSLPAGPVERAAD